MNTLISPVRRVDTASRFPSHRAPRVRFFRNLRPTFAFRIGKLLPAAAFALFLLFSHVNAYADWQLVWHDEFEGTALNTNDWYSDNGWGSCEEGNDELQLYTNAPASLQLTNGMLRIIGSLTQIGNSNVITSARIKTWNQNECNGAFDRTVQSPRVWTYGAFECRAKLPATAYSWPVFWMMPWTDPTRNGRQSRVYGSWPACGEFDIAEGNGDPNYIHQVLHYYNGASGLFAPMSSSVTNWHVYRCEWYTNEIDFIVDGVTNLAVTNWASSPGYAYPAPFDARSKGFYLLLMLNLGGPFVGSPTYSTVASNLPTEMDVDYVRVYQQLPPLALTLAQTNGAVVLSWPTNIVCHLQAQMNAVGLGDPSAWTDVASATNPYTFVPSGDGAVFRLQSP